MKNKNKLIIFFAIASACVIVIASMIFVKDVQSLLWEKSVTDILEITAQGRRSLDTYLDKDAEMMHLLTEEMELLEADDEDTIKQLMDIYESRTALFYCTNLDTGVTYANVENIPTLDEEQKQEYLALPQFGINEPTIDKSIGIRTISMYERFTFKDGTQGLIMKSRPVQSMTESFSLSFYDNTGFSFVVNEKGDVLIRSLHKNSNRTFQNIFDMIDEDANDEALITEFKEKMMLQQTGITKFVYQDASYVFCYVPMMTDNHWYVVSIIPNAIIMQQANDIIVRAICLCLLVLLSMGLFGYLYHMDNKRHHKQTEQLAFYDHLTGLYRYEKFLDEGEQRLRGSQPYAVLYMDIIGFKLLNDIEGYAIGDQVLQYIADIIRKISNPDDISCRVSGDDFILLKAYEKRDEIMTLCRDIIKETGCNPSRNRTLKVRIGVCLREDVSERINISGLVDRARLAQKKVHEEAREPIQFYNQMMRTNMLRDAEIEEQMEKALADGEFLYMIQPKYSYDGKTILGGEALVRWKKGTQGYISPGVFVPLFEKDGFICKIDEYVFERVCIDLKKRLDNGEKVVPISVNVSRIHLLWNNFAESYIAIKEKYQIPDGMIELELTESAVQTHTSEIYTILGNLREHGFPCSIDDFGSGYSSLNTLKDMPVDVLKLDRVFFQQSVNNEKNKVILRSMISMAKQLAIKVVAEGIETEEQKAMLENTECDMIQGFIYDRPLEVEDFYQKLDA